MAAWFYIGLLVIAIALLCLYHRTGRLLRCMLFTACSGIAALALLWGLGKMIAVPLAVTPLTAIVSALMGVPGVIVVLLMNLM